MFIMDLARRFDMVPLGKSPTERRDPMTSGLYSIDEMTARVQRGSPAMAFAASIRLDIKLIISLRDLVSTLKAMQFPN